MFLSGPACVWSLQSVLCSYIFSLNLFSTLSLCIFTLPPMCMCAEGPAANSTVGPVFVCASEFSASCWHQARGVGPGCGASGWAGDGLGLSSWRKLPRSAPCLTLTNSWDTQGAGSRKSWRRSAGVMGTLWLQHHQGHESQRTIKKALAIALAKDWSRTVGNSLPHEGPKPYKAEIRSSLCCIKLDLFCYPPAVVHLPMCDCKSQR